VAAGLILLLVAGAAVVIVVTQNTDRVDFEFLWWSIRAPLSALLLIVAFVVVSIDQVVGLVWRRRRRRVRQLTQASR
jgi:uncharacterized integral membrane protein